jgi:hypothetical protein
MKKILTEGESPMNGVVASKILEYFHDDNRNQKLLPG